MSHTTPLHAPLPWTVEKWADKQTSKGLSIKSADGFVANMVMSLRDNEKANAAFIVRACNAWNDPDALLARLHELSEIDEARREHARAA